MMSNPQSMGKSPSAGHPGDLFSDPKQEHVLHGVDNSIVCVSAAATPLHMSAAFEGLDVEVVTPRTQQPHTEGATQPVTTALSAIRRVTSCTRMHDSSRKENITFKTGHEPEEEKTDVLDDETNAGTAKAQFVRAAYEESPVPALKATLIKNKVTQGAMDTSKPLVLIIIIGGTICMDYAYRNSCLRPARLGRKLTRLPELEEKSLPYFDVLEWNNLVDSSDIGRDHYVTLGKQIETYYAHYDGFVILHGTDTMAYTASVLSFMLENVGKPVVLTGSTLPMMHISSDAKRNVGLSLMVAAYSGLTEVVVVFGSQVLRGTRVTKTNCNSINAFSSPNFPAIGSIGVDVVIHDRIKAGPPKGKFRVFTDLQCAVCTVKLTPGMPVEVLEAVLNTKVRPFAVVLELFGAGTAPNNDRFLGAIKRALDSGIAVVASTQCHKGATNLLIYENGVWISSLGVISARDMTPEAIAAKLYYLMGKGISGRKLKELMEMNMRGEVTVTPNKIQGGDAVDELFHTEIAQKLA